MTFDEDWLRSEFDQLSADVSPAPNRRAAIADRVRRYRRTRNSVVATFSAVALIAAGVTYTQLPGSSGHNNARLVTPLDSTSPTPGVTTTDTPTLTPSPTDTPSATDTPTPAANASPSEGPPAPLTISLNAPSHQAIAGQEYDVTFHWSDGAGSTIGGDNVLWGDEQTPISAARLEKCTDSTGDGPGGETMVLRHTYQTPGNYKMQVEFMTYGCHATPETQIATWSVQVVSSYPADRPDGAPGWSTTYTSCSLPTAPADSNDVPANTTVSMQLDNTSVPAGTRINATVVITNAGTTATTFTVLDINHDGLLTRPDGTDVSSSHGTDSAGNEIVTLQPQETKSYTYSVYTTACGDTSYDAETPVPAGSYQARAFFNWQQGNSTTHTWATSADVTVT